GHFAEKLEERGWIDPERLGYVANLRLKVGRVGIGAPAKAEAVQRVLRATEESGYRLIFNVTQFLKLGDRASEIERAVCSTRPRVREQVAGTKITHRGSVPYARVASSGDLCDVWFRDGTRLR